MKIHVLLPSGDAVEIQARETWSLKDAIRDAGIDIIAQCGGGCACATCHVHVTPEWSVKLCPPSVDESALLETLDDYHPMLSRLSCQINCDESMDGLSVSLQPGSWEE